jgi:ADP-ribose pyrophosphatase YjhB (NUDIX family)
VDPLTSPRRIDYYDDPDAPKANSLVPSVNVVVVNDAGEILLIRRTDNGTWAVPGGAIDLGESVAQAAVRETLEESGIECAITGIVGIYSDPKHVILYTSNGEARQEFSIVLAARAVRGQPTPSSESTAFDLGVSKRSPPLPRLDERLRDPYVTRVKVYVSSPQPCQLAPPDARERGEQDEGTVPDRNELGELARARG